MAKRRRRRRYCKEQSRAVQRIRSTLGQPISREEIELGAHGSTRNIRDYHDREDAMQEYRIAVWMAEAKVDPARNPKPFLKTCGRHAVIDFCKYRYRRPAPLSLDAPSSEHSNMILHESIPAPLPGPAVEAEQHDLIHLLRQLITSLPERLRRVLELVIDGHNTHEISKRLGHSRQLINRRKAEASEVLLRELRRRTSA